MSHRFSGTADTHEKSPTKTVSLLTFLTKLILICVLPLIIMAIYLVIHHIQYLQTQQAGQADHQVRNAATAIDRQLKAKISALQLMAASPLLDSPAALEKFYIQIEAFRDNFGGHVILADSSMQMILNTREAYGATLPKLPRSKGTAAAPKALETGLPAVGDIVFGPVAKEPLIAVAVPVIRDKEIRYILLATFETRRFQQSLDEVSIPNGWSLRLLDGAGDMIAGRFTTQINGSPNLVEPSKNFSADSAVAGWTLVLKVPKIIYRAPILEAALALIIAIVTATIVSFIGGHVAGRRLAKSVASLVRPLAGEISLPNITEIETVRRKLFETETARNAAERNMIDSQQRYKDLWEKAPVMMISLDRDARINFASDRFCEELGYDRDEIVGKTPFEFQTQDSADYAKSVVFRTFLQTGSVKDAPLSLIRKNGEIIDVILSVTAERDSEGNIVSSRSVFIDVTERKRAEEAIRTSEANYSDLYENAPDMYASIDPTSGIILQCNKTFVRILGYTKEELIGRPVFEIYDPASLDEARTALQSFAYTGKVENVELQVKCKDLSTLDVILNATAVYDETGKILHSRSSLRDITDRKKAEQEIHRLNTQLERRVLERTEELETANRELESFSYSVSHDLRAPLRAISGFAQILATDYPERLDDRGRHYLNNVVEASSHMDRLIVDLLSYSRVGRKLVTYETTDLSDILARLKRTMTNQFQEIGGSLTIQENIPAVIGDETLVDRIFANLIVNAWTYRRKDVPLQVTITGHAEDNCAIIQITDNGIGIRPEYWQKIFNIFQRLHNQDDYPGTGIGLSIVKKSVGLLKGEVSVESVPGQGSTFSVKLPLAT